jgi:hypothetical protein
MNKKVLALKNIAPMSIRQKRIGLVRKVMDLFAKLKYHSETGIFRLSLESKRVPSVVAGFENGEVNYNALELSTIMKQFMKQIGLLSKKFYLEDHQDRSAEQLIKDLVPYEDRFFLKDVISFFRKIADEQHVNQGLKEKALASLLVMFIFEAPGPMNEQLAQRDKTKPLIELLVKMLHSPNIISQEPD